MTPASDANPLTNIRQRVEAIDGAPTKEQWAIMREQIDGTFIFGTERYGNIGIAWNMLNAKNNAEFIANAPADIRFLLDTIDRLLTADEANRRLVDSLREALKPFADLDFMQWAELSYVLGRSNVSLLLNAAKAIFPNADPLQRIDPPTPKDTTHE